MTGSEANQCHVPVLLEEVLEGLAIRQGGVYLDGTLGLGGHALSILEVSPGVQVVGVDKDPEAVAAARIRLSSYGDRVRIYHGDFSDLEDILDDAGIHRVNGILLDLGVSSMQLENARRGFSFSHDGPLDMRMDTSKGGSAAELVNSWSREDLAQLFFRYGEEKRSRAIASAILRNREVEPIGSTARLSRIISEVPGMAKVRNIHPATRVFQALRIQVNDELGALERVIPAAVERLEGGGRLAIISFHSLEDRIVKHAFRRLEDPCRCPKTFPQCQCGKVSSGRVVTRKPVLPSPEELSVNPRSRSAKLRVFEKSSARGAGLRAQ